MAKQNRTTYNAEHPTGVVEEVIVPDAPLEVNRIADASIFDQFGPATEVVHPVKIMVAGIETTFYIKQHSMSAAAIIEMKRYRIDGGRISRDLAYEGINGLIWELHYSVMQNTGTEDTPIWKPLLPSEAWQERIDDPRDEVKQVISHLAMQVWRFNDELMPSKKKAMVMAMGL